MVDVGSIASGAANLLGRGIGATAKGAEAVVVGTAKFAGRSWLQEIAPGLGGVTGEIRQAYEQLEARVAQQETISGNVPFVLEEMGLSLQRISETSKQQVAILAQSLVVEKQILDAVSLGGARSFGAGGAGAPSTAKAVAEGAVAGGLSAWLLRALPGALLSAGVLTALSALVVKGITSNRQERAPGEPPPGPNWFGSYDWREHDRRVLERRERERMSGAALDSTIPPGNVVEPSNEPSWLSGVIGWLGGKAASSAKATFGPAWGDVAQGLHGFTDDSGLPDATRAGPPMDTKGFGLWDKMKSWFGGTTEPEVTPAPSIPPPETSAPPEDTRIPTSATATQGQMSATPVGYQVLSGGLKGGTGARSGASSKDLTITARELVFKADKIIWDVLGAGGAGGGLGGAPGIIRTSLSGTVTQGALPGLAAKSPGGIPLGPDLRAAFPISIPGAAGVAGLPGMSGPIGAIGPPGAAAPGAVSSAPGAGTAPAPETAPSALPAAPSAPPTTAETTPAAPVTSAIPMPRSRPVPIPQSRPGAASGADMAFNLPTAEPAPYVPAPAMVTPPAAGVTPSIPAPAATQAAPPAPPKAPAPAPQAFRVKVDPSSMAAGYIKSGVVRADTGMFGGMAVSKAAQAIMSNPNFSKLPPDIQAYVAGASARGELDLNRVAPYLGPLLTPEDKARMKESGVEIVPSGKQTSLDTLTMAGGVRPEPARESMSSDDWWKPMLEPGNTAPYQEPTAPVQVASNEMPPQAPEATMPSINPEDRGGIYARMWQDSSFGTMTG